MDHSHPFVRYLNGSVSLVLLILALPTLLNRKEPLNVRISFFLIFFTVIFTCIENVRIVHAGADQRVVEMFLVFFVPVSFGPLVYTYVKSLLGAPVRRWIWLSMLPGLAAFGYGCYLATVAESERRRVFEQVMRGGHTLYEIVNLSILLSTLFFCALAWRFAGRIQPDQQHPLLLQLRHKRAWAREFVAYLFGSVFVFLAIAVVAVKGFGLLQADLDLIVMPAFMLLLYLLITLRSLIMYKDFEHQFVVAKLEGEKAIQQQRLELASNLHDSLGARLTLIQALAEDVHAHAQDLDGKTRHKISALAECSGHSVDELKSALWALHAEGVTLGDLRQKITNFIAAAAEAKESIRFHCVFDVPDAAPLPSGQAVHLLRLMQELTNNAIKHARPTRIDLSLKLVEKRLQLRLSDDGTGFPATQPGSDSYGLDSIESRVRELGGTLRRSATDPRGTTYLIEATL